MVSTGGRHTALLRSDGCAVAVGKMMLDNATFATFHPWRECHTSRFRLAEVIHCFSEVMAMLWPADWTYLDLAPFHRGMKEFHTPRFCRGRSHSASPK